jgi:hypothetical protein
LNKYLNQKEEKFRKTSETIERFSSAISVTCFSRLNTEKKDGHETANRYGGNLVWWDMAVCP